MLNKRNLISKPLKLLFDMTQFQHFDSNGGETGIYRTADEIFKKLAARNDIDLYCLVDGYKNYKNIVNYLKKTNPDYIAKIIYLKYLKKMARDKNFILKIKSKFFYVLYNKKYSNIIKKFDWYFSPFDIINPLFYKKIKTSIIIHDMIPLLYQQFADPEFTNYFTKLIASIEADFIFCDSQCTKDDFLKYCKNYDPDKVTIAFLAADDKFRPIQNKILIDKVKEKYHIKTEKYFLSVSNFNPRKNLLFVVKNFLNFIENNQINDLSLVLSGPQKEQFKQNLLTTLTKHQASKIVFTDFINDADLVALYNGALVFTYMSLYEGFGLPPLEAMQSGVPVITSNNSSLKEVVGDAAITLDPQDNEALTLAFQAVYNDDSIRDNLSKKGLERAKHFSWDKVADQIVNVFVQN